MGRLGPRGQLLGEPAAGGVRLVRLYACSCWWTSILPIQRGEQDEASGATCVCVSAECRCICVLCALVPAANTSPTLLLGCGDV